MKLIRMKMILVNFSLFPRKEKYSNVLFIKISHIRYALDYESRYKFFNLI